MSDIYEPDLRDVVYLIGLLKTAFSPEERDAFIVSATLQVYNGNDYPVGTIAYEDEQFRFTSHTDLS